MSSPAFENRLIETSAQRVGYYFDLHERGGVVLANLSERKEFSGVTLFAEQRGASKREDVSPGDAAQRVGPSDPANSISIRVLNHARARGIALRPGLETARGAAAAGRGGEGRATSKSLRRADGKAQDMASSAFAPFPRPRIPASTELTPLHAYTPFLSRLTHNLDARSLEWTSPRPQSIGPRPPLPASTFESTLPSSGLRC